MLDGDRFAAGMAARRRVLGDEYVDRALANASEFGRPLPEFGYAGVPAAVTALRIAQDVLATDNHATHS